MPKSLEMTSGGLDFDTFMKALVSVPTKQALGKTTGKRKRKKIAPPRRGR
jgi:hypothetical protein